MPPTERLDSDDPMDLTMREIQEADEYALDENQYARLKNDFYSRFKQRHIEEVEAEIRADAENTKLRPAVINSIRTEDGPKFRAEIEKELRPKLKEELRAEIAATYLQETKDALRKDVEADLLKKYPTAKQRRGIAEYLLDMEVECVSAAELATKEGQSLQRTNSFKTGLSRAITILLMAALGPSAFLVYQRMGLNPLGLVFLVPFLVMWLYSHLALKSKPRLMLGGRYMTQAPDHATNATKYLILAEEARRLRLITLPSALSKPQLDKLLDDFVGRKREVDESYPDKDLQHLPKIRIDVKRRMVEDVDPLKLFELEEESAEEDPAKAQHENAAKS